MKNDFVVRPLESSFADRLPPGAGAPADRAIAHGTPGTVATDMPPGSKWSRPSSEIEVVRPEKVTSSP